MTQKSKVKATKLTVGLPFNLGPWNLRATNPNSVQPGHSMWSSARGLRRSRCRRVRAFCAMALTSLYGVFDITREILRQAGPEIGRGVLTSFGAIAIEVINKDCARFL